MLASSSLLSLILLASASVQPAQLPAAGKGAATIRIDRAGMYRISARSGVGTACSLVDHQRGPFAEAGTVGKVDCELDLLLDEGVYLLRTTSPKKARGQVTVSVDPFAEIFAEPLGLERGREDQTTLKPTQQASWWVRIDERRQVALRVIGRTAGEVRLWRDGKWIEEIAARHEELSPKKGQPLHAWLLSGTLEAGDYLLTAYGTKAKRFSKGTESDVLFVANGYPAGDPSRSESFTLPAWGQQSFLVPKGRLAAFVAMDQAPGGEITLAVLDMPDEKGDAPGSQVSRGAIKPKALVPLCAAFGNQDHRHVITITGPPGESGQLRWAGYHGGSLLADDLYSAPSTSLQFDAPASGSYLVAVDDVPLDTDAAPLSCELLPVRHVRFGRPQRDYLRLGGGRGLERSFNYDGREATIWFEVTESGVYRIATGGERENRCELYQFDGQKRVRLTESHADAKTCQEQRPLGQGFYELKLYRGRPGIERLTIRPEGSRSGLPFGLGDRKAPAAKMTSKASCRFAGADLQRGGRYRIALNRTGRLTARGLQLRALPLSLDRPLPLVLDAGERLELPLASGGRIEVRSVGRRDFQCALGSSATSVAQDGICRLDETGKRDRLVLTNPGPEALALTVLRPKPRVRPPALAAHSPALRKLTRIEPGETRFFDFDRQQSHSMTFDVSEAGLYHLETEGLLATECRVRTPIFPRLAAQRGGGRGRNCLVASYLRPGRYLLTATTTGRSRGRGGVRVERRPVREKSGLKGEGNSYFRVDADELVQQKIRITADGRYSLSTRGQGVSLDCRLEDGEGWPLLRVPTSCQQTLELDAGTYLWGQMPLTVESMRRTRLARVRPPEVLGGEKTHPIELNRAYTADLGPDGQDRFRLSLRAPMDAEVFLNKGMQGRIYQMAAGKRGDLVAVIPPAGLAGAVITTGRDDCSCGSEAECDARCGGGDAGGARAKSGRGLSLAAGEYLLETEHARADVGIRYQLSLSTLTLAPGLSRDDMAVPGAAKVRMPEDGVLRIKSAGETDVRCRLFDEAGKLLAEASDIGADWNCLLAIPVAAGEYRLVLEAENNLAGSTRISVNSPSVREIGTLADGQVLTTGNHVLLADLPQPKTGAIQEVGFTSKLRFSCALEDGAGQVLQSQMNVLRCGFLVNPLGQKYRLRLWTRRWSGKLKTKMVSRKIEKMNSGEIDRGEAALVTVARAGLYETAKKVWCLPAKTSGPLAYCGGRASLEKGPVIFSTTGPDREPDLEMNEAIVELDGRVQESGRLTDRPRWQRQESKEKALQLFALRMPPGTQAEPACRIDGGVHQQLPGACFAVGGPDRAALTRWWSSGSDRPRPAELTRIAAAVPEVATPLRPGAKLLVWSGAAARYRLPAGAARIELLLPGDAWAVQTSAAGEAQDFCPPQGRLERCVLGARGGELLLVSNAERQARVRLLMVDRPPIRKALTGLLERWPRSAGQTRLSVPSASGPRVLEVSGATHCRAALEDGTRMSGCRMTIPAGAGAEVDLEHQARPLQAVVAPVADLAQVRWGRPAPKGAARPLLEAQTAALTGELSEGLLQIGGRVAVHLQADAGLCSLWRGQTLLQVAGQGAGCDLHRLLEPGEYRIQVRSFAGQALAGSMVWTSRPVSVLHEGIGQEDWLAPGQTLTYSFRVETDGRVGLGLQTEADLLRCRIMDASQEALGTGCQQFIDLKAGEYLLAVDAPADARPLRFRPVLLGLAGSRIGVPENYLRDLFKRIGLKRMGGER